MIETSPLVAAAFKEKTPASMREVAETYGALLSSVNKKWTAATDKKSALNADEETLRQVLYAADSPPAAIDACALGEGEQIIVNLVEALQNGSPLDEVDGLYLRNKDGSLVRTRSQKRQRVLSTMSRPAWDLAPIDQYLDKGFMTGVDFGRAREELGVPGRFRIEAAAAIGRIGDKSLLPEVLQASEAPSHRKAVSEFSFEGSFPG